MEWQINDSLAYTGVGIGWLIAVLCILRKYIWKNGTIVCPLSDIITATFASITLIVVVNFTFSLYIDLRDSKQENVILEKDIVSRNSSLDQLRNQHSSLTREYADLQARNRELASSNSQLRRDLSELYASTIVGQLRAMWVSRHEDKIRTRSPLDRHFGKENEYKIEVLKFEFFEDSSRIRCMLEGNNLECSKG